MKDVRRSKKDLTALFQQKDKKVIISDYHISCSPNLRKIQEEIERNFIDLLHMAKNLARLLVDHDKGLRNRFSIHCDIPDHSSLHVFTLSNLTMRTSLP